MNEQDAITPPTNEELQKMLIEQIEKIDKRKLAAIIAILPLLVDTLISTVNDGIREEKERQNIEKFAKDSKKMNEVKK